MLIDSRRAAEVGILEQIERFVGWLGPTETVRQKLVQLLEALRESFNEEARHDARIQAALTQLQEWVLQIRSGPIRKLVKIQVAALCRSRDVAVAWKAKRRA
jgi:chemotaxis protein histidine kinase CheA